VAQIYARELGRPVISPQEMHDPVISPQELRGPVIPPGIEWPSHTPGNWISSFSQRTTGRNKMEDFEPASTWGIPIYNTWTAR
jgi:hypothetical protein